MLHLGASYKFTHQDGALGGREYFAGFKAILLKFVKTEL